MEQKVSILIVDDDPQLRKTLSDILTAKGFAPEAVDRGKTALEKIEGGMNPAVALIDLRLDDMPGLEVMREINDLSQSTECIILTGYASRETAIEAVNLGAYSYVEKPYDVDRLLLTIRRAIERREAVEELIRLKDFNQGIVQNTMEGIVVQDDRGYFSSTNPAAADLLGYTMDELLGRHWTEVVPPDQHAIVQSADERRVRGDSDRYEVQLARKDGARVHVLVSGGPRFEGDRFIGTMAVFTDITDRKLAEEEIRRRASQQEAINAIIVTAARAQELSELIEKTLNHTLCILGLEQGGIWLEGGDQAIIGLPMEMQSAIPQALQDDRSSVENLIAIEDWELEGKGPYADLIPVMAGFGIRSSLTFPIVGEEKIIGGMTLASPRPRLWSVEEIGLVEVVGRHLGVAAERLSLLEKTREQTLQMRGVLDTVQDGILMLDSSGHVLLANSAARNYLSILTDFDQGKAISDLGGIPLQEFFTVRKDILPHTVKLKIEPRRSFEIYVNPAYVGPETGSWTLLIREVTDASGQLK